MERADMTHAPIKTSTDMRRRAADGAQSHDANNKPQRPKKPQSLSSEKVKTVSTKNDNDKASDILKSVHVRVRRPSYIDLEAAPAIKIQERPQSLPITTAPHTNLFADNHRTSFAASANEWQSSEAGQVELLRVRSLILEAGYDFPDLRGRSGETAVDAVARLLEQYRKLNTSLQDSQLGLANSSSKDDKTRSMMRKELISTKDELRYTKTELQNCETAVLEKKRGLSKAEALIKTMVAKHEKDSKKYKSKIKDLEQQLDTSGGEILRLRQELRIFTSNQAANADLKQDTDALHRTIHSLKVQNVELVSSHTAKLKKETDALVAERNDLKASYERQLSDLRGEMFMKTKKDQHLHNEAMKGLQKHIETEQVKWATHMHTLKAELEGRMMDRDQDANKRLREQEEKHAKALETERMSFEKKKKTLEAQLRQQQTHLQEAQKTYEQMRAEGQRRLETELRRLEQSLKGQYESEQYQLRSAVEDLKGALVAKEHSKGLTDPEITSRFAKLTQEVEDFARLDWDLSREAEWLTPHLQRLQPRNSRKLKQAIVQNSVWIGLRERVFRSPFAMFAEEDGWRESDSPWVDIYTLSTPPSDWPRIPRDTEKVRYETAKRLRTTIDPSVKLGANDRRGKLRITYENLVESTVNALARNIMNVAAFKDKDRKALHKIVRLSAELWIECCSQRYRLMVTLEDGIKDVLTVPLHNIPLLKLVLKPQLRKFGNAHGDRMESEEPVAGWRSAVEIHPPQRAVSA